MFINLKINNTRIFSQEKHKELDKSTPMISVEKYVSTKLRRVND
jgi:hypothetical protein